jgi:hypothetical protein
VARVNLEFFFQIPGAFIKIGGLRVDFGKGRGLFLDGGDFSGFRIILQYEMMIDSVHGSWTAGGSFHNGPLSGTDWKPLERGGTLTGAWSPTAPELGSSPTRVGCGEGRTVKSARRSPGLVRRRDGRAVMANWRW